MKKINYGGSSKILNGIVTKINAIIDSMVVDVKVNDVSVVDENHVANIDLTLADQNVKQSPTTDNADYRILLSKSANDTEETDISRKNTNFKYNPSTGNLQVSKVNGNTVPSGSGNDTLAKTSDIPDMTNYIQKSQTSGLVKNDGTIDQTQYATMSDIPDELADLADDVNHRLVTDTEKNTWNNNRAVAEIRLTNEDLDNVTTPGFYFAAGGNTVTNKPTGYNNFGLVVIHNASGSQYTQIISNETGSYRRIKKADGTWTSWEQDKFTDANVTQTNNTDSTALPLLLANSNTDTTETSGVKKNLGITFQPNNGTFRMVRQHTSTTTQDQQLVIGNDKANGTSGSVRGILALYQKTEFWTKLIARDSSANRNYYLPKDRPDWSELAVVEQTAVSLELALDADLNDVLTPGFYVGITGNSIANKPSGVAQFGLVVIKTATSFPYYWKQILYRPNASGDEWTRTCIQSSGNPLWSDWVKSEVTDEKVKQVNVTTGAYYVLFGKTNTLDTETDYVQKNGGIKYYPASANLLLVRQHTATTAANTRLEIGNNIAVGTAGNVYATLRLYGRGAYRVDITDSDNVLTADRVLKLPNKDGTIATTDDAEKVKQSPITISNTDYPLLMAYSDNSTEETQPIWKDTNITYNPSTRKFKVLQAEFGILQATTYDIGLGNNIKASIHPNALAESTVDSYLPIESGELALEEWQNRIGSMNLLPQKTTHKSGRVSSGATFTVNLDGTITVNRTTTSGTATFDLTSSSINGGMWLPNGTYYVKGCPQGGSTSTTSGYQLGVRCQKNNATYQLVNEAGNGATFTVDGDDFSSNGAWVRVVIILRANVSATNMLWKPMITLTSLSNRKTYYPPSMSNRQLTFEKMDSVNVATIENTDNASKAYAVNDYMVLRGQLYRVTQAISNGGAITINTNVTATTVGAELKAIRTALNL